MTMRMLLCDFLTRVPLEGVLPWSDEGLSHGEKTKKLLEHFGTDLQQRTRIPF
jgi:hypothetical protein